MIILGKTISPSTATGTAIGALIVLIVAFAVNITHKITSIANTVDASVQEQNARIKSQAESPRLMGAGGSGFVPLGTSNFGPGGYIQASAFTKVSVPQASCVNAWFLTPGLVPGQHTAVSAYVAFDSMVDAALYGGCDAGNCIADAWDLFPGVLQGNNFCRGDGVCAASPINFYGAATDAGLMYGDNASVVYLSDAGTLAVQVCCQNACSASGGISSQWSSPIPFFDAGPFDAGNGPVLPALAFPQIASASGTMIPLTVPCTSGCSGATLVTVGSATAVPSASTNTSVTFVPPANTAGGTAYSLSVTTPSGNSNTLANAFVYVDSGEQSCYYPGELGTLTVVTGASQITDFIGGTRHLVQATTGAQPGLGTLGAGLAPEVMTFNGTSQFMCETTQVLTQPYVTYGAANYTANATVQLIFDSGGTTPRGITYYDGSRASLNAGSQLDGPGSGTSALSFLGSFFNGGSSIMTIGASGITGAGGTNNTTGICVGAADVGGTPSNFLAGSVVFVCLENSPGGGTTTTMHAMSATLTGTP